MSELNTIQNEDKAGVDAKDQSIVEVDPIFTDVVISEENNIAENIVCIDMELPPRYSTKLMDQDILANLYRTISDNIINIGSIVENEKHKVIKVSEEVVAKKKLKKGQVSGKKEMLLSKLEKDKKEDVLSGFIKSMRSHQSSLLDGENPTIESITGILETYKSSMSNKIMKLIILRSLITKYKKTGNDLFVPFIFEFMMELNYINKEWLIESQVIVASNEASASVPVVRRGGRAARQALRQNVIVSDFDLPTVEELSSETFSENIKTAILCSVKEAEHILEIKNIDSVKYQMIETYYRLKPLSTWDKKVLSLDDWQREIIDDINNKRSVVITAPTSCGKTVCAAYCGYSPEVKKILFVVPCSVLANQVAGSFSNSGFKTALVTNEEKYNLSEDCKIIVATPNKAEEILCDLSLKLDYAVFDEIQQINELEGESIERLIKTVNCPFLILSATIFEPEKFVDFLKLVTKRDVKLVSYNKRFIVQQKHLWNGSELITMHPLSCVDVDYIKEDQFKTGDLAMTSRDLYEMGIKMSELFPEEANVWNLHPNKYFNKSVPITMDMISIYEKHLKDSLIKLTFSKPDDVSSFLTNISSSSSIWNVEEKELIPSLVKLFKNLKAKDMLPALVFNLNDVAVLNIFKNMITHLEFMDSYYFPWYHKLWGEIQDKINVFTQNEEKLIEQIASGFKGSRGNPTKQIQDRLNQEKREFIKSFLATVQHKYVSEKNKALNNEIFTESEKQMIGLYLDSDYKYRHNTYLSNQLNSQEIVLPEFNQYGPISLFSFHVTPLSVTEMRLIVKNLKDFLSSSVDKSIAKEMTYENIFVRGIERGIILYSKILPTPFQRIVQELITNKRAPICICDDSLAYGVNYPARTVVILGSKPEGETISVLKAQQISGRSGRRGFDTQGHIIYCRVNYKNIMRGTYAPLIGKDIITQYSLLPTKIYGDINSSQYINSIISVPLNQYVKGLTDEWNDYKQEYLSDLKTIYQESFLFQQNGILSMLLWYFRDDVLVAPNIFNLITVLLKYKYSVVIETTKKYFDKKNNFIVETFKSHIEPDDRVIQSTPNISTKLNKENIDQKTFLKFHCDEPEFDIGCVNTVIKYNMPDTLKFQIIELLFKVLIQNEPTNDEDKQDEQKDQSIKFVSKDKSFHSILISDIWNVRLNHDCNDVINYIIQNNVNTTDIGQIASVVNRVHTLILHILKIYNLFAKIGNQDIVSVLDQPLTHIINFNNKLKSLN